MNANDIINIIWAVAGAIVVIILAWSFLRG